jgi:uncharacterized protein YlxW (UPF0749 family)
MRFLFVLVVLVCSVAQEPPKTDKLALRQEIADLKVKAFELQQKIELLEHQLKDVEEAEANRPVISPALKTVAKTRCAGHTKDGARCSRNAEPGSRFCWQHKARR